MHSTRTSSGYYFSYVRRYHCYFAEDCSRRLITVVVDHPGPTNSLFLHSTVYQVSQPALLVTSRHKFLPAFHFADEAFLEPSRIHRLAFWEETRWKAPQALV